MFATPFRPHQLPRQATWGALPRATLLTALFVALLTACHGTRSGDETAASKPTHPTVMHSGGVSGTDTQLRRDAAPAIGQAQTAHVVRVIDGDTLLVALHNGSRQRIRMVGIDAPEALQPGGRDSAQALQRLIGDGRIRLQALKIDPYGRTVAMVWRDNPGRMSDRNPDGKLDSKSGSKSDSESDSKLDSKSDSESDREPPTEPGIEPDDIGLDMIRTGHAWYYRRYGGELTAQDRVRYDAAETRARHERRGLWALPDARAPWRWRASSR